MKAVIKINLSRKTRHGLTAVIEMIIAKKEEIVSKVNEFIYWRINQKNYIPAVCFEVAVYDSKNNKVNSWSYSPTYRD